MIPIWAISLAGVRKYSPTSWYLSEPSHWQGSGNIHQHHDTYLSHLIGRGRKIFTNIMIPIWAISLAGVRKYSPTSWYLSEPSHWQGSGNIHQHHDTYLSHLIGRGQEILTNIMIEQLFHVVGKMFRYTLWTTVMSSPFTNMDEV